MSESRLRPSDPVPFGPLKHRPALAAAASAVIPGAGQWFQGRRRQATPLLVLSAVGLLATIGTIWLLNRRGPVYILEVAMRPGALAAIFVLNALFMGVHAWAAADAYRGGQPLGTHGAAVAGVVVWHWSYCHTLRLALGRRRLTKLSPPSSYNRRGSQRAPPHRHGGRASVSLFSS